MLTGLVALAMAASAQRYSCMLGLSINVSVQGGVKEMTDSILEERQLGCRLMTTALKWSELEPSPGKFKLDHLREDLAGQERLGFIPVLTLKTIDTNNRSLPADLMAEVWDSPKMLSREQELLKQVAANLPKSIGVVLLGNEVDAYLAGHPAEVEAFSRFLASGRAIVQAARPGTQVGVTTIFSGLAEHRDLIDRVQKGMDLVSMTYYPLNPDFTVLPARDVPKHFDQMIAFCGSRRLFVQEAGYPASPLLNSSDAKQAAFVDAVFDSVSRLSAQIYGVNFFLLVDLNDARVNSFVAYYGVHAEKFRAMLSTLGFKDQNGNPRPAWERFKRRARGAG